MTLAEAAALVASSLPPHRGVLEIMHDPHKDTSLSVDAWIRLFDDPTEWPSPEERAAAIAANSVWMALWTTDDLTERRVAASSLPALLVHLAAEVSP